MEHDGYEDDAIVFCDLCNSSFHQSCFGSELLNLSEDDDSIFLEKKVFSPHINKGEWFCHRCTYIIKNDLSFDAVVCEFCPELKGAIKRIKENSNKKWGHVACVNWIDEMYYVDEQEYFSFWLKIFF